MRGITYHARVCLSIVLDCATEHTINSILSSAFGAAGQRCMALSCVVFVGESKQLIHEIARRAKDLKVRFYCVVYGLSYIYDRVFCNLCTDMCDVIITCAVLCNNYAIIPSPFISFHRCRWVPATWTAWTWGR